MKRKFIDGRPVQTEGAIVTKKNRVKKFSGSGKALLQDHWRKETDAKRRALIERMKNK